MTDEITATPEAIAHIEKMLAKRGQGIGMRLSVKESGCSGKSYVVNLIDEVGVNDVVFELTNNIKLCVDPASFIYLAGTEIDYVKKGLNGQFVYHNPNEKAACGCGESFYV